MKQKNEIIIKGARLNNLKNISVKIPKNQIVVITGLSGSGIYGKVGDFISSSPHK